MSTKATYLTAWEENDCLSHGFFTREGGASSGLYRGLNCGRGSQDNPLDIERNYMSIAREMGVKESRILTLYQIHSAKCIAVSDPWGVDDRPQADAMVTNVPGLVLGILTADCVPVLFAGKDRNGSPVIGAAHAGWRGALAGVLQTTLVEMQKLGAELSSMKAAIGPCIAQRSYEVGQEFIDQVTAQDEAHERFFIGSQLPSKYYFDIAGFCASLLAQAGVRSVVMLDEDTYAQEERFFSYRRATHREERDYGRQISMIAIKE